MMKFVLSGMQGGSTSLHAVLYGASGSRVYLAVAELFQLLLLRPTYGRSPSELFENPDDSGVAVELSSHHTVACTRGVRMVKIVPRLAAREDCQGPEVGRPVPLARFEGPLTVDVANRIDAPCYVVQQSDPHEAGPEERQQHPVPRLRHEASNGHGEK